MDEINNPSDKEDINTGQEERTKKEFMTDDERKELEWYRKRYPYIKKRGLNNVKNLFRRPNSYEVLIFMMLCLALFMAWAYNADTATCRETVKNNIAFFYNSSQNQTNPLNNPLNIPTEVNANNSSITCNSTGWIDGCQKGG